MAIERSQQARAYIAERRTTRLRFGHASVADPECHPAILACTHNLLDGGVRPQRTTSVAAMFSWKSPHHVGHNARPSRG
jgi:hypothetical protein